MSEDTDASRAAELEFVTTAYRGILRRLPDADGLASYVEKLLSKEISREELLTILSTSSEFRRSPSIQDMDNDTNIIPYLNETSRKSREKFLSHRPFSLSDLEEAVAPLKGLEYFENHKQRFLEMLNAVDYIASKHGGEISILEIGSIFSTKIIKTLIPNALISTVDVLEPSEIGIVGYYLLSDLVEAHYKFDLNEADLDRVNLAGDNLFDLVLICEVIEHLLVSPVKLVRFLIRQLKPGGWLYLTTPNLFKKANLAAFQQRTNPLPWIDENATRREGSLAHIREFGMGELLSVVEKASGEVEAFEFSACWDAPESSETLSWHDRGNLVLLVRKPSATN